MTYELHAARDPRFGPHVGTRCYITFRKNAHITFYEYFKKFKYLLEIETRFIQPSKLQLVTLATPDNLIAEKVLNVYSVVKIN